MWLISICSELVCHRNAIFDISWLPGGKKLVRNYKLNMNPVLDS